MKIKFSGHDECDIEVMDEFIEHFNDFTIDFEVSYYNRSNMRHSKACITRSRKTPEQPQDKLAKLIWETSRADEGTISAIGAQKIARAILDAGYRLENLPPTASEPLTDSKF